MWESYIERATWSHAEGDCGWTDPEKEVFNTEAHIEKISKLFDKVKDLG